MLKKIVLGLFALIILAVAGITIYLNMIDWNKHKTLISRQFSEATGKEVSFDGAVSFSLLPSPYLEADNVSMYNIDINGNKIILAKIPKLVAELSINSLFRGRFNVDKMRIVKPEIFVELLENGQLNWESSKPEKDFEISNVDMSFGSVMLEDAKVYFVSQKYDFRTAIENVKAEISADSIFGPYRIEGSYVRKGVPGGFALDLGKFSESFATSVNMVISHPQSESYARFDGTLLLRNDAVNGNVAIESKNPINFFNSTFDGYKLSEEYEHPLAMALAIKSDKNQIALSNVVIKYNDSAGAGNILIPRKEEKIEESNKKRKHVDLAFNMTELNVEPVLKMLKNFWNKYDGKDYVPDSNLDIIADLKAVKTYYRDQVIRDLDLSVDFVNNVLTVQKFSMRMPFDGLVSAKGELFSVEKAMTYNFDVDVAVTEFAKTAQWLGYELKPLSKSLYKQASAKFTVSGNQHTIKIAPFVFNLDKTGITGKIGLVRGKTNKYFIIAEADKINFDDYVADMPEEVASQRLEEKLKYRFAQLGMLKDKDVQFRLSLNSGIWGQIPFDKVYAEGALKDGVLKFNELGINDVATAQLAFRGEIGGFGSEPTVKHLTYGIDVKNNATFVEKMQIKLPSVNLKNLSELVAKGVVTGDFNRAEMKVTSKISDIDAAYDGEIIKGEQGYAWDGKFEMRSNDFVRTLNNFAVDYHPDYPLGVFKMLANVKGNAAKLLLKNADINIGGNNFKGEILYSAKDERKHIKANLNVNKFEFERFFYNTNTQAEASAFRIKAEKVPFLSKPILSKTKIDYDVFKDWDVEAKVHSDSVSLSGLSLTNASWLMVLDKQVLNITKFSADDGDGVVEADLTLNVPNGKELKGKLNLRNITIDGEKWSGLTYGLPKGILMTDFEFNTVASSVEDILTQFSGKGTFKITKPLVKGVDLSVIQNDLENRTSIDGVKMMMRENLSRGETVFDSFDGNFEVNKGNYRIYDSVFNSDNYSIDVIVNGNLKNWVQEATFNVAFGDVSDLARFNFTLDGPMNAPSLDVDLSSLADMYEKREQQLIAEAKAAENAKVEKYRALMGLQQEFVAKSKIRFDEMIMPEFTTYSEKAEDAEMREEYAKVNQKLSEISAKIKSITDKKDMPAVTDDVIAELQKQNDAIAEELTVIAENLRDLHAQDVRLRIKDYYDKVMKRTENVSKYYSDFMDINGAFNNRLAAVETEFSIEQDAEARSIKQKLERLMSEVETLRRKVGHENITAQNVRDAVLLENYATSFADAYKRINANLEDMKKSTEEYSKYVDGLVSAEEEAYNKRLRDAALKQKINENTGRIATAGGKTVTFKPNLEEIERMEDLLKKEDRKVLDFSGDN